MKISRLKLRNIGTFGAVDIDFTGPVIGLIGHNGSGKSTIVEAIYAGITGDFRRYSDALAYISDAPGGTKEASGTITVEFSHKNLKLVVVRSLTVVARANDSTARQNAELRITTPGIAEPEVVTGVRAVDARIQEILNTPLSVIGQFAFIEQGQICQLVSSDAATRTKAIHSLFGLDRFEELWKLLGTESTRIPVVEVAEQPDALENKRAAVVQERAAVVQTRDMEQAKLDSRSIEDAQRELDTYAQFDMASKQLREVDNQLAVALSSRDNATTQLAAANADKARLDREIQQSAEPAIAATKFLETVRHRTVVLARSADVDKQELALRQTYTQLAATQAELANAKQTLPGWDTSQQQRLDELCAKATSIRQFLAGVQRLEGASQDARCPCCGQPIRDVVAAIADHKRQLDDVLPAFTALKARHDEHVASVRRYEVAEATYNGAVAQFTANVESCKQLRANVTAQLATYIGDFSEEACARQRSFLSEYDSLVGQVTAVKRQIAELESAVKIATRTYDSVAAARDKLALSFHAYGDVSRFTSTFIEGCLEKVRAASTTQIALARYSEQIIAFDRQLVDIDARIVRAREMVNRAALYTRVRGLLTDARAVFHRDSLPQALAAARITAVDQRLRHFLSLLQSNYTTAIELTSRGYSFVCTFDDGTIRDASTLSGGEKVRFSLSFILAVNDVLAGELGIVVMDEPTDQLDDDNKQHLAEVLAHVQNYAKTVGMQLFIVTHVPQLQASFDQTLWLHRGAIQEAA